MHVGRTVRTSDGGCALTVVQYGQLAKRLASSNHSEDLVPLRYFQLTLYMSQTDRQTDNPSQQPLITQSRSTAVHDRRHG